MKNTEFEKKIKMTMISLKQNLYRATSSVTFPVYFLSESIWIQVNLHIAESDQQRKQFNPFAAKYHFVFAQAVKEFERLIEGSFLSCEPILADQILRYTQIQ